jgi:type VI secretion system protein ImpM
VTEQATASPGFFGKLPSRGDFISRRLPASFLDPWDQWLQGGIARSKEQLADRWLDIYMTSPIWRFVLSSGIAGQECWAGALIPSVDRVGRYFPLTLAAALPTHANPFDVLADGSQWFAQAEALLLSCLEEDFDFDLFEQSVAATAPLLAGLLQSKSARHQSPPPPPSAHNAWHVPLAQPSDLPAAAPGLLSQACLTLFFAYSLWWTAGSDRVQPSLLLCQGLPPTDGFAALLGGDWSQWGWQERSVVLAPPPLPRLDRPKLP